MCGKDNSPVSIFTPDCPLAMTRQENEFRLAMVEKMRQASYRGIEAEFKMPFFSTRLAVDSEGSGEVGEAGKVDDATKVVKVSDVTPATNEELGLKFESHNAEPSESADIPDAEHPYVDETLYFTPEGQDKELPVDCRYRPTERQWQVHDFPCPWGGTVPPPMPPVESEAMPDKESPVTNEDLNNAIEKLEFKFYELMRSVQAYDERIEDLISDVEMLKAGAESGGVHDQSIPTPSFPAGQESVPASEPQPLHIHPYRFIAHKDTVIDTARCGEFTTSNPHFTADMLNAGQDWYSGAYRQFPKVTERHRIFNERAAVIAQESIPLCRAVEYIILGDEMYDPDSFDLNSYLKGDGKFLRPLDRTYSICIAIEWLRVELRRLRHERLRDEAERIVAEGE